METILNKPRQVLGLVASPRMGGNSELFTKEISQQIEGEHELRLIRLNTLDIRPCKGCYACIMDKPCPNKDDMGFLLGEIAAADAVIVAAPVYYFSAHGSIKKVLDRGFLFSTVLQQTYGKPCILLNFHGLKERIGVAPQMLQTFAASFGLVCKASINIKAALPGEALMSKANLSMAKRLAGLLFSSKKLEKKYGCPFCGCEIVRATKSGFICTLCHGSLKSDADGHLLKVKDGGVFGTMAHLLRHKTELQGKKRKFLAKRKEIMRLVEKYKDIGIWVEPTRD